MASCFRGALPPVDFLAVCFVRAIFDDDLLWRLEKNRNAVLRSIDHKVFSDEFGYFSVFIWVQKRTKREKVDKIYYF